MNVLLTGLIIAVSTLIGTVAGFTFKKIPHKYNDLLLGGAAGVMLGAAVLGLIVPAAGCAGRFALLLTVLGVLSGALLVSMLDKVTPHLHHLVGIDKEAHAHNAGVSKVLLFVSAIAIHKLPEGLAAGVSFGTENMSDVLTVAGSISLQNIPEAMVVVAPLLAVGVTRLRAMLISLSIGVISMTGTFLGYYLVSITAVLLPFLLAFAGGTMMYVISDEMIPETHSHGFEKQATFALLSGFLLILVLQSLVG
ncbi:MAG: ZIP family metal transporter [Oligosphaeraceae bacterium]|nr:ZIP family metal transporter [Oligosphaeraceae bacterium]